MKKSINKLINNYELIALIMFSNIIYIVVYYLVFQVEFNTMIYTATHSLLSIILSYYIFSAVQLSNFKGRFSASSITLIISNIYFFISSIKYTQEFLYPGFITNNMTRLVGSVLVFSSIFIASYWWKMLNKKRRFAVDPEDEKIAVKKSIVYIFLVLYIIFVLVEYAKNPVSRYLVAYQSPTAMEQFISLTNAIVRNLLILSGVIIYEKNSLKKKVPLILIICIFTFNSMVSGSRAALISPLFLILYLLIRQKKMSFKSFFYIVNFAPLTYIVFTVVVFMTSGRIATFRDKGIAWDIAYRFDFSDFPMTILTKNKMFFFDFGQIIDGFRLSVPSILWPSKLGAIGTNTQIELLLNSGLSSFTDYTDSFFSMGAEFAGVLGLIFLFPILVYVFEKIDYALSKKGSFGLLVSVLIFDLFTRIEIPWINFIPLLRDRVLSLVIGLLLYKIFLRIKKKNTSKSNTLNRKEL